MRLRAQWVEHAVCSLDATHQAWMAKLVLCGWTIKAEESFTLPRWTATPPSRANLAAERYHANTLMTLLDTIPEAVL